MKKIRIFILIGVLIGALIGCLSIMSQVEKNKISNDENAASHIRTCFYDVFETESAYNEIINSSVKEVAFADASSIKNACLNIGENFANELSKKLSDLKTPKSKNAKEYVIKWVISEDGELEKVECNIRLNDDTYLENNDGKTIDGMIVE